LGAEYVGKDNQKHAPVLLHRAALGSLERFIGILTEEYAGDFPFWLAPVQVRVLPVSEKFSEYADKIYKELCEADIRAEIDNSNEKVGYKIRQGELAKIPYLLIVGDKEIAANTVSIRKRKEGDLGQKGLGEFLLLANPRLQSL
jgi:threonyl-tRNA synthetase